MSLLDWAWKWFWWWVEYVSLVYRRTKNVEKGREQARKSRRWLDVAGYCYLVMNSWCSGLSLNLKHGSLSLRTRLSHCHSCQITSFDKSFAHYCSVPVNQFKFHKCTKNVIIFRLKNNCVKGYKWRYRHSVIMLKACIVMIIIVCAPVLLYLYKY